jgi:hypothetical protein
MHGSGSSIHARGGWPVVGQCRRTGRSALWNDDTLHEPEYGQQVRLVVPVPVRGVRGEYGDGMYLAHRREADRCPRADSDHI